MNFPSRHPLNTAAAPGPLRVVAGADASLVLSTGLLNATHAMTLINRMGMTSR
jgi:hypothetical protein